jgi:hypothetical protein
MQLGSGTYDVQPGLTYLGESGHWAWGAQALTTFRIGRNDAGYSFGDVFRGTGWFAYGLTEWFAPFLRAEGRVWGNIDGRDPRLSPTVNPESDPNRQGGGRIDMLGGVNLYVPRGALKGLRLVLEGGVPVYENLDGPQLSREFSAAAGLSYSF